MFLEGPDVQPDTNHLERALRPIPMGNKNWMFCWTELGAEHVGIIQSLISTCKLHGINPYTYLVDVLQRTSLHPASEVADLTPRLWKTRFAEIPLRARIDPRHPDHQSQQPEVTVPMRIDVMNIGQLLELNQTICRRIDELRDQESLQALNQLRVGLKVAFDSREGSVLGSSPRSTARV